MRSLPVFEILQTAHQALMRNWGRAVLTSLSMVIGTASLVLVIVAGISGRDYTLEQIRGVGTNLVAISNESVDSAMRSRALADLLNFEDLKSIKTIPGVRNAVAVMTGHPTYTEQGVARRISLIGTTPEYQQVRNIKVVQGSFIDDSDERSRNKVCLVTELLAKKLEADPFHKKDAISFYGLQFTVIGVFKERVNTFGQTEISDYSAIIPLSVMRYFKPGEPVDQIYVSAETMEAVPQVSDEIKRVLTSRHRNQSFRLDNLSDILSAANKISLGLTLVLLVIAAISLVASGISIMNIMLITVTERTREIGLKKSIGAVRRVLLTEFLVEALLLSSGGGIVGVLLGAAVPYSVRFFTDAVKIQIPPVAIILGFGVTLLVGLTFGMIPALRASRMNPVEALRYE